MKLFLFLLLIGLIIVGIFVGPALTQWRRNRLQRLAFPLLWNAVVENTLPIYWRLTSNERKRLQGHIQVFLAEKQFIGCAGLQVTEEMKLTIASVACLLLLNERGEYFPRLRSVLLYPTAYIVTETVTTGGYVIEEKRTARLGESWTNDQVVLSWEQVKEDTYRWQDGRNVVLHEFAHQLDQAEGSAEGVPVLPYKPDYFRWAQVMAREYQQLCKDVQRGVHTVINSYGSTNPAEFFAVATETFFEKPQQLLKQHPELYELLCNYYQLNPVKWFTDS